ncbi:hypothetical protein [Spirillospora sp. CA-294931]|uniref:hypothetical protein n=1 Tax=Spirillospora sp. CA-294931 TaxID=3240042 RepID=UPI003D8E8A8B
MQLVDEKTGTVLDDFGTDDGDVPQAVYSTYLVPGLGDVEADALIAKVQEFDDIVSEHREMLSADWQTAAMARETELAEKEIRETGKVSAKRTSVVAQWATERSHVRARLNIMRDEVRALDRAAYAAIRSDVVAANGPAVERVKSAIAAYEDAVSAMARAAAEVKSAVTHAHTVQGVLRNGTVPRGSADFGHLALGGMDDNAVYEAREAVKVVKQRAARILSGGVRYVAGQEVVFSMEGGLVQRTLDAEGAAYMNQNDMDSVRLLLSLDASAVPVIGFENE